MRVRRGNSLTSGADTLMIPRCPRALEVFLLLTILIPLRSVWAFPITPCAPIVPFSNCGGLVFFTPSSSLYSSNPPRRKARRSLPKRRRKKSKTGVEFGEPTSYSEVPSSTSSATTAAPKNEDVVVEIRPLVSATARESGEDACKQKKEFVT